MSKKFIPEQFKNLEVEDITALGKGVVKSKEGKVIFVSGVIPGNKISLETFKKRKGSFEGKLIKMNEPSKDRILPECEHFGICGGCKWQNMSYEVQLLFKQKQILNNLKNLSGMVLPEIENIQPAPEPYFYRNKMEYTFSNKRWLTADEIADKSMKIEKKGLGFHKAGMWDKVVDIHKCYLQPEPANEIRNSIKSFALENELEFFNPSKQEGFLRSLMIRNSNRGELMVLIQFLDENKSQREALMNFLKDQFEIASLLYCINSKSNDTLYDQEVICYSGKSYITEEMDGLHFKINAKSFFQTNTRQAYELYKIARDFAGLHGKELVYDLYTGIGTIAQFVAKECNKVVGVESVPEAIKAAQYNAKDNGIKNAFFEVGDMRKVFNQDFITKHGKADVVITDPPRNGMHRDVVKQLLLLKPEKIVYLSCNNATQARDLYLMKEKYKLVRSRAVDMFPQTQHVENVVLLEKI